MQLESARHDLVRVRDQLEAQTLSSKVASAQCKSAQTELETLKRQLANHSLSSLSEQSNFESAKCQLNAQLDSVSHELKTQAKLSHDSQAELSSVRCELECTKIELVSVGEALRLEKESSKAQEEQMQQQKSELRTQVKEHAEQLRRAEGEYLKASRESEQIKVSLSLYHCDFRLSICNAQQLDSAAGPDQERAQQCPVNSLATTLVASLINSW